MKSTYKASMDSDANQITVVITFLFTALLVIELSIFHFGTAVSISASLLLFIIYSGAYLFHPVSYEITNDLLIIHRPVKDVTIPRQNLNKIEIIDKEQIKYTSHNLRISGFFGYFGKFRNKNIGDFTSYATRRNKTVLIETIDHKTVIVTPDRPSRFIKQLKNC